MNSAEEAKETNGAEDTAETEEEKDEKVARVMKAMGEELIDELQALIGEQIEKYHEEKIKRDMGEEPARGPRPGMKPAARARMPQALIQQYFTLN